MMSSIFRCSESLVHRFFAMSSNDIFSKLSSPLHDLLTGSAQQGQQQLGVSEKDQAEIAGWIEKAAQSDFVKSDAFLSLDSHLVPRTYLVSNYLTAADLAVYGVLQPVFAKLQPAQYHSHPALTRYFDHIQSHPCVRKSAEALAPAFDFVPLDFSTAPRIERKALDTKKKEKPPKSTENSSSPAPVANKTEGSETKPDAIAGKEEKKKAAEKPKTTPAATEDAGSPIPSMIDLRVGHIVEVKKHPDADGLYVEQIDFGEESGPRTVVSGLVNYIPIEQMQDKWLVGVLASSLDVSFQATSKDGKEGGIEIVQPPPNSKPGDRVYFEGPEHEDKAPLSQLNPKKKIFETIQPGFTTLETREAAWVDPVTKTAHRIRTREGVCQAPSLIGASLS
ncbi:nucleic acid-binding protein [Russula aff. rugulosa BPL654]|nr:nucleic acid-binding protein [Russula aff. rugulosa BPL654]